jgi:membrane-bound lytic murein transglycosylase D
MGHALNPQVQYWIDRLSGREKRAFQSQLTRLDRIRPSMERIFDQHGIPRDLVYLCLVESGARANAVSCSGAAGYWQFIPDTAKKFGLQVNRYVDERKNLDKSTRAAAQYLKHLYGLFGDWYLAIAAYNAGEGAVMRLMKNSGVETFWDIDDSMAIKMETIEYVPKYIATVILAGNREGYGLPPAQPAPPDTIDDAEFLDVLAGTEGIRGPLAQTAPVVATDAGNASLPGLREHLWKDGGPGTESTERASGGRNIRYTVRKGDTLYSLARRHKTTVDAICRANAQPLKKGLKPGMKISIPSGTLHAAGKGPKVQSRTHVVAQGENLQVIARDHDVSVQEIIDANRIKEPGLIQPKTVLVIPKSRGTGKSAESRSSKYIVRKGDTIWGISRQFEVPSADLMRWNRLSPTAQLRPGDRLTIRHQ